MDCAPKNPKLDRLAHQQLLSTEPQPTHIWYVDYTLQGQAIHTIKDEMWFVGW